MTDVPDVDHHGASGWWALRITQAFQFFLGPDQPVHKLGLLLAPKPAALGQGAVRLQQGRKKIHTPHSVLKVLFVSAQICHGGHIIRVQAPS